MKVDINKLYQNQNVDKETAYTASNSINSPRMAERIGGYILDISGTVTDNNAYGIDNLKSAEDIMKNAGLKDVSLQRNQMAVMSNSMSAEDFAEFQKEGGSVLDMSEELCVTNLDKIKIKMAESGTIIEGYNDDLTDEELKKVVGNDGLVEEIKSSFTKRDVPITVENVKLVADALDKAEEITNLSDDIKKYMVAGNIEPSIGNLYISEFSAGKDNNRVAKGFYSDTTKGYYAKCADDVDLNQIKNQVENIINKSGLEVNEQTLKEAEWIIRKGLPLTEENLGNLNRLNKIEMPLTAERVVDISAIALSDYKTPLSGMVDKKLSDIETHISITEAVDKISDNAIRGVLSDGLNLNIKNLAAYSNKMSGAREINSSDYTKEELIAKRKLEEVRLYMSAEANLSLIRKGINIETRPLEQLVTDLKNAEMEYYEPLLLPDSSKLQNDRDTILASRIELYKNSLEIYDKLPNIPVEVLSNINEESADFTAVNLLNQGNKLNGIYSKLEKAYEPLMTAPRADLGDSIKKAFANVDDILKDVGFEINDINRKAVRILGYSGTEINRNNLENVRNAERCVSRVINMMTPQNTLKLIREGYNPIDDNLFELQDTLFENEENATGEKYSRFLRKLEERNEISENEREAFIGIYRLFRQIEKSDGRIIGDVLKSGAELTFRNLLSVGRNNRKVGKEYVIDDDFGFLEEVRGNENSILAEISKGFSGHQGYENKDESYYEKLAKDVFDSFNPSRVEEILQNPDMTLENYAAKVAYENNDNVYTKKMREEDFKQLKDVQDLTPDARKLLDYCKEEVSVNNLLAASDLINKKGKLEKRLNLEAALQNRNEYLKAFSDGIIEAASNESDLNNAYDEYLKASEKLVNEAIDRADRAVDVRELTLLNKQLNIRGALAEHNDYEIPVKIDDEWTSINLKIIRNGLEEGIVSASLETEKLGKISGKFRQEEGKIDGFILGSRQDSVDFLERNNAVLVENFRQSGFDVKNINYARGESVSEFDFSNSTGNVGTNELFEIGKAFVESMRRYGYEN